MTNQILHKWKDETPEEEEDEMEDGNVYARDLPTPSMDGFTSLPDTVFREMKDYRCITGIRYILWV
jgi:hypothetical protein